MADSNQIKEEIRSANDIVDVIGGYIQLKKSSSTYMGLCPFHGEKTPSFSVSPSRQMYYCFGCNKGGDVFSFIQEYENVTFPEAMKILADRAGIKIPENMTYNSDSGKGKEKEALRELHKVAAIYYFDTLKSEIGKDAMKYLVNRKLSSSTICKFGLGYAPNDGAALYRHVKDKGYDDDDLLKKSGLFTYKKGVRDKFVNRVMYPIMDDNSKVIAFGGRVMDDGQPKYLNSPETPIFEKGNNLYGFHVARRTKNNRMFLAEGYMDVISMHQSGFTEAVASLGTALTENQAKKISRVVNNVYIIYDSDDAGTRAKLRAIPILRAAGLNAYVISLGGYKDPDEFLKNKGPNGMEECIRKAEDGFVFEIRNLQNEYNRSNPADEADFERVAAERISEFSMQDLDEDKARFMSVRNSYISKISDEFSIQKDMLRDMVESNVAVKRRDGRLGTSTVGGIAPQHKIRTEHTGSSNKNVPRGRVIDKNIVEAEKILITAITEHPGLISVIEKYLRIDELINPISSEVGRIIKEQAAKGELNISAIPYEFESEDSDYVTNILNSKEVKYTGSDDEIRQAIEEATRNILLKKLDKDKTMPLNEYTNEKTRLQNFKMDFE